MALYTDQNIPVVQEIAGLMEDANNRFASFDQAHEFDLSFGLDGEHYNNDNSFDERALDRIKPRDPGLFRVWRYKLALLLDRFGVRIEARPKVPGIAPELVERARRRVEALVFDPFRNHRDARRRMVGSALGARAGAIRLCYDSETGLYFDNPPIPTVRWCEGFIHPHHPKNPWVSFSARLPVEQVKRMKGWKVPANLKGDPGFRIQQPGGTSGGYAGGAAAPHEREGTSQKFVTVVAFYCRFQQPEPTRRKARGLELEPMMRYLACEACGWTSPPQAEAMTEYPPAAPCPDCGAPAARVEHVPNERDGIKYRNGKRLIICAPFAQRPDEPPFYDDDWEFDYPTFPLAYLVAYPVPHQPIGQSDTSLLKTVTLAKDALVRLSYETLLRSMPYWVLPSSGVTNVYGLDFSFDPADGNAILSDHMPGSVYMLQGQGVGPSIFTLMQQLDAQFRTNESTSEVALSPSQLSEAKVGAVEQYTETGNVVLDDHGALLYEQEGFLFSCVAAALREIPSEDVPVQDPQTGAWDFERIGGPTMAEVQITVSAGHSLEDMDKDEIEAFMALAQMPPELRQGFAALKHIDPSVFKMLPPPMPVAPGGPVNPNAAPVPVPMTQGVPNG